MSQRELTEAQSKWIAEYKSVTAGCEPTIRKDDFDEGKISFGQYAMANVQWYLNSTREQMGLLLDQIPQD